MMTWALTATPPVSPIRVVLPGFQGVNQTPEDLTFLAEHLAQHLRVPGLVVVTGREVAAVLGYERQKLLLGCGNESCVAELSQALGADALLVGDAARFGETWQINLKVLSATDASVIATESKRVEGQLAALDALVAMGRSFARKLLSSRGRALPAELTTKTQAGPAKTWALLPLSLGVAAAGAGIGLLVSARFDYDQLVGTGSPLSTAQTMSLATSGTTKQSLGFAALGVGVAGFVAAGVWWLMGSAPPSVALAVFREGAGVSVSGAFP